MQRSARALVVALLLSFLAGAWTATPAFAAEKPASGAATVGIRTADAAGGDDRGRYDYEIVPRGVRVDYVEVSNFRRRPVTVRLFAKDATSTTESPFEVQTSAARPTDVGGWIALRRTRLTLPPRSRSIVPFQVGVPGGATPGDHVGAIVLSLLSKEKAPNGSTVVVDRRVGLRVYLRVPGALKPSLEVQDLEADWDGTWHPDGRGDAQVSYTVRNTGNVRLGGTHALSLTRALGMPDIDASSTQLPEILPGGSISVSQRVPGVLGTGPMRAEVTLSPESTVDGSGVGPVPVATTDVRFSAWPLVTVAALVVLLLSSAAYLWLRRRRRRAGGPGDDLHGVFGSEEEPEPVAVAAVPGQRHHAPSAPAPKRAPKREGATRTSQVVAGLLLVGGLLGLGAAPAAAEPTTPDVWKGTLSTREGTDQSALDLVTSGACPLPATNVVGFISGHGFGKDSVAVGNNSAGVRSDGPFQIPLVDTFRGLMDMQPRRTALRGDYRISLYCITPGMERTLGVYRAEVRFTSPTRWKALPPVTRAQGPRAGAADPSVSAQRAGRSGAAGTTSRRARQGSPASSGAAAAAGPGASGPGAGASDPSAGPSSEDSRARAAQLSGVDAPATESGGVSWPLIGLGLLVLAAVAVWLVRTRRPRTAP